MRQVLAIARREWRAFAQGGMAPVIAAGFLVLTGLFYYIFVRGYADISETMIQSGQWRFLNLHAGIFHKLYGNVVLFLLFLLPAVTMRLFSGEYRSGRWELIASWPVSVRRWVLGKWLSGLMVAGALLLGAAFYFGMTAAVGAFADPPVRPDWQPMLTSLLGLTLLAGAVLAWGLAASALVAHQAAAYFLGFGLSLALFLVGQLEPFLAPALARVAASLALGNHFLAFAGGVIDSRDVVYFLGVTAVGLAAAEAAVAQRRLPRGRRLRPWLNVAVVLVGAVFLLLVAERRPLRADLTPDRLYSLAPQTEQVLRGLERPVTVTAYYQGLDSRRRHMQARLRSFRDVTDRIRYSFVDPINDPEAAQEAGVTLARTVIVRCEDRRLVLVDPSQEQLANAIYRVATDTRPVVYWLLGQGEARIDLGETGGAILAAELLGEHGYAVRPLVLAERSGIPDDASAVIWAGPKVDPSPALLEALDAYLDAGGAVLGLFGPDSPGAVRQWTERRYAVRQHDDVVISPTRATAAAGLGLRTVVLGADDYSDHPIVRRLREQGIATTFSQVQTLRYAPVPGREIDGHILLLTPPGTWGETDPATRNTGRPRFDAQSDRPGPKPFGVLLDVPRSTAPPPAATAGADTAAADPGQLIIVGSSGMITNRNLGYYGNRDLLLNIMSWLADEEDLLGIRGRRASFQPLLLGPAQEQWLGAVAVLVWPALVGFGWFAVVVIHRRRH